MMINRCLSIDNLFNQFLRLMDTILNLCLDERLAVKAGHINILVCGDDDTVTGSNLFFCEDILGTT